MKLIQRIIEPDRVLVIWQAPDRVFRQHTGTRYVVGEIVRSAHGATLRYFDNADVRAALAAGFTGFTAYPYQPHKEFNGTLLDVLGKRLPPSDRTDYTDYLRSHLLSPACANASPLTLLAYTGGRLAGDGFSFAHTFEGAKAPFEFTFEIAGFRHSGLKAFPEFTKLLGHTVEVTNEYDNSYDPEAVAVRYQATLLGHVPKGTNGMLRRIALDYTLAASIEKINGTMERPNVTVYVAVR